MTTQKMRLTNLYEVDTTYTTVKLFMLLMVFLHFKYRSNPTSVSSPKI